MNTPFLHVIDINNSTYSRKNSNNIRVTLNILESHIEQFNTKAALVLVRGLNPSLLHDSATDVYIKENYCSLHKNNLLGWYVDELRRLTLLADRKANMSLIAYPSTNNLSKEARFACHDMNEIATELSNVLQKSIMMIVDIQKKTSKKYISKPSLDKPLSNNDSDNYLKDNGIEDVSGTKYNENDLNKELDTIQLDIQKFHFRVAQPPPTWLPNPEMYWNSSLWAYALTLYDPDIDAYRLGLVRWMEECQNISYSYMDRVVWFVFIIEAILRNINKLISHDSMMRQIFGKIDEFMVNNDDHTKLFVAMKNTLRDACSINVKQSVEVHVTSNKDMSTSTNMCNDVNCDPYIFDIPRGGICPLNRRLF